MPECTSAQHASGRVLALSKPYVTARDGPPPSFGRRSIHKPKRLNGNQGQPLGAQCRRSLPQQPVTAATAGFQPGYCHQISRTYCVATTGPTLTQIWITCASFHREEPSQPHRSAPDPDVFENARSARFHDQCTRNGREPHRRECEARRHRGMDRRQHGPAVSRRSGRRSRFVFGPDEADASFSRAED
jgi:hypothetical protein